MKKNNPKIILTIFSVIVGIFIATQIKMGLKIYAPVTIKSLQGTKAEIKSINNEISEQIRIIEAKEEELKILEDIARDKENIEKGEENMIDIFLTDIKFNKMSTGQFSLEGPGIIITMYDNPEDRAAGYDLNYDLIHDVDILYILNDLRKSGVEAISINGERVIARSGVKCNGPIVRVNGKSSATPFVIKAIGDPKLLYAAINAPRTYGYVLRNFYGIGVETTIEDSVFIEAFTGNLNYKYAKQKGKGD